MQGELSLADYWRILQKRKWEVLGSVVLVLSITSLVLRRQVPVYRTAAKIKLESASPLTGNMFQGFQSYYENPIATESNVIESRAIAEAVARQLAPEAAEHPERLQEVITQVQGSVKADPIVDTNIIKVVATGPDPERVAQLANLTALAYIENNLLEKNKQARKVREFVEVQVADTDRRLRAAEERLKEMRDQGQASGLAVNLQNRIIDVEAELARLRPRLTDAHPDVQRFKEQLAQLQRQLEGLPGAEVEYARILREREVNEKTYRTLRERLEEARIAEAEKIADAIIIERAVVPASSITPGRQFAMGIGGMLGLLLGCVLAFVFEALDTSIGTIEDVERLLQVPVLAVIPHLGRQEEPVPLHIRWPFRRRGRGRDPSAEMRSALHAHYQPHSVATEAFRILRTNLKLGPDRKVILVTSSGPAEGKTKLVSNLGLVAAQGGAKTLLISADLRRPELDRVFGLEHEAGLVEVLQGSSRFDQGLHGLSDFILGKFGFDETMKHPYLANLFIMNSGHRLPTSPAELLGSKAMTDLLTAARTQFDLVLLDLPPILPVADSLVLAPQVDGVVLVYQVGRISRGALLRAKTQLDSVGATMFGVVLNHVRPEVKTEPQYYYYAYQKRYAQRKAAGEPPRAESPSPS